MKLKTTLKIFSWIVPFAPAVIYGMTQFPLIVQNSADGWSVTLGSILLLIVLGPLFLSKQKLIKSRVLIFMMLFGGFAMINAVITQLTWIFGLTTLGVALDDIVLSPWILVLEDKEGDKNGK